MFKSSNVKRISFSFIATVVLISFITPLVLPQTVMAQSLALPAPGTMVLQSNPYTPVMIKGLKVHADNPLMFDFIVDSGKSGLSVDSLAFKTETQKLIKYFLAVLAIKDEDLWVNLSPYEKDKIIPNDLGKTALGQDMLAQDYLLKQITASMMYPEKELGKSFWDKVFAKAQQQFGTTDIPVDTFNKVWIVADQAKVLERGDTALVVGSHLKVMLEEDYKALGKNHQDGPMNSYAHSISSQIVREIILPELEKEVNQGEHFAPLRQMFYAMILSTWYKMALKESLLNQVYSNQAKVGGVLADDPENKEKIYQQYLSAYKKGVFSYIKDDVKNSRQDSHPRKYFSGGIAKDLGIPQVLQRVETATPQERARLKAGDMAMVTVNVAKAPKNVRVANKAQQKILLSFDINTKAMRTLGSSPTGVVLKELEFAQSHANQLNQLIGMAQLGEVSYQGASLITGYSGGLLLGMAVVLYDQANLPKTLLLLSADDSLADYFIDLKKVNRADILIRSIGQIDPKLDEKNNKLVISDDQAMTINRKVMDYLQQTVIRLEEDNTVSNMSRKLLEIFGDGFKVFSLDDMLDAQLTPPIIKADKIHMNYANTQEFIRLVQDPYYLFFEVKNKTSETFILGIKRGSAFKVLNEIQKKSLARVNRLENAYKRVSGLMSGVLVQRRRSNELLKNRKAISQEIEEERKKQIDFTRAYQAIAYFSNSGIKDNNEVRTDVQSLDVYQLNGYITEIKATLVKGEQFRMSLTDTSSLRLNINKDFFYLTPVERARLLMALKGIAIKEENIRVINIAGDKAMTVRSNSGKLQSISLKLSKASTMVQGFFDDRVGNVDFIKHDINISDASIKQQLINLMGIVSSDLVKAEFFVIEQTDRTFGAGIYLRMQNKKSDVVVLFNTPEFKTPEEVIKEFIAYSGPEPIDIANVNKIIPLDVSYQVNPETNSIIIGSLAPLLVGSDRAMTLDQKDVQSVKDVINAFKRGFVDNQILKNKLKELGLLVVSVKRGIDSITYDGDEYLISANSHQIIGKADKQEVSDIAQDLNHLTYTITILKNNKEVRAVAVFNRGTAIEYVDSEIKFTLKKLLALEVKEAELRRDSNAGNIYLLDIEHLRNRLEYQANVFLGLGGQLSPIVMKYIRSVRSLKRAYSVFFTDDPYLKITLQWSKNASPINVQVFDGKNFFHSLPPMMQAREKVKLSLVVAGVGVREATILERINDEVMSSPGGIDLSAKHMVLNRSKEGAGVSMRFDPALIAEFKKGDFTGVEGVIVRIVPIVNPLSF